MSTCEQPRELTGGFGAHFNTTFRPHAHYARQQLAKRRQGRLVRNVAGREQQRAFLAVKGAELRLQLGVKMGVAADVARSARTGPDLMQRLVHRGDDDRVLAHPQVVVGAPHGDRLGPVAAEAAGVGILAAGAQYVDEHAIAALVVQPPDRFLEDAIVVQLVPRSRAL